MSATNRMKAETNGQMKPPATLSTQEQRLVIDALALRLDGGAPACAPEDLAAEVERLGHMLLCHKEMLLKGRQ